MKTIGCNALLCILFVVCIMSGSAEGTMCELGWLSHDGESIGSVSRTYSFSGSCSTQSDGETITNFSYAVTGNWNQAAGLAEEKVSTPYGFLTRSYTCDYDPWLEPGASCSSAGQQQWAPINSPFVAAIDFPAAFGRMNNFKTFPVSAAVLDNGYRMDMAELAMSRSLAIIAPENEQTYTTPDFIVTVTADRPVITPPNRLFTIKVDEILWPDGSGTQPRHFDDAKTYLSSAKKLTAYFNLKGKNLWDGRWQVKAHVLNQYPDWTAGPFFTVGKSQFQDISSNLIQLQSTELNAPTIHFPRHNRTYQFPKEEVPLQISYQPDRELHVELACRAEGSGGFVVIKETVIGKDDTGTPGFYKTNIGAAALWAGAAIAELKIRAWVEMAQAVNQPLTLPNRSEASSVVTRVIVDPLEIENPAEGQTYGTPAQVLFSIPFIYPGVDLDLEKYVEVRMEWADTAGDNMVAKIFRPYSNGSYTTTRVGNKVMIIYSCKDLGAYRLRARFVIPGTSSYQGLTLPWSGWRRIQLVGMLGQGVHKKMMIKPGIALKPTPGPPGIHSDGQSPNSLNPVQQKLHPLPKPAGFSKKATAEPSLVLPRPDQEFARSGPVQLKVMGGTDPENVDWQIEYRPFDGRKYQLLPVSTRQQIHLVGAGNLASGTFKATKEGEYRIRLRNKTGDGKWSDWRTFAVGKAIVEKPQENLTNTSEKQPKLKTTKPIQSGQPEKNDLKQPELKNHKESVSPVKPPVKLTPKVSPKVQLKTD